jgi:hypothetical protein
MRVSPAGVLRACVLLRASRGQTKISTQEQEQSLVELLSFFIISTGFHHGLGCLVPALLCLTIFPPLEA